MSIHDEIRKHVDKRLFLLEESAFGGEDSPRKMFISEEFFYGFSEAWPDTREGRRHAQARAVLDDFVAGGYLTIAENPFDKASKAILARVDPVEDEIWDFRCLDPRPGIRVLGCFSDTDEFIALVWDYRESLDWSELVARCKESWRELFGNLQPHKGGELSCYVSYNFEAV